MLRSELKRQDFNAANHAQEVAPLILKYLKEHPDEMFSTSDLLDAVFPGRSKMDEVRKEQIRNSGIRALGILKSNGAVEEIYSQAYLQVFYGIKL